MPRPDASHKRCAIYTRKSSEEGLEQEFNSLAAQREACEAYIRSQQHEGWALARTRYDDGGFSGGNMQRPALQHLLADIRAPDRAQGLRFAAREIEDRRCGQPTAATSAATESRSAIDTGGSVI